MSVSVAGLGEVPIEAKEANHFAAPGDEASSEGFEIAAARGRIQRQLRPRTWPSRVTMASFSCSPERMALARTLTSAEVSMRVRRRIAPTSLALHEHVCAVAQCRSCAELPVFHDAPG